MKFAALILAAPMLANAQTALECLPLPGGSNPGWQASDTFDWQVTANGAWAEWDCYSDTVGTPAKTYTYVVLPSRYAGAVGALRAAMLTGTALEYVRGVKALPLTDPKFAAIMADRAAFYAAKSAKN